MTADHEFGNLSTDLKLSLVEEYLGAFTTALRSKFAELWYIDAFAGTGERTIKHKRVEARNWLPEIEEKIERRRGSARIALDISPPFDRVIFMDKKKAHCTALEALRAEYPTRLIDVVRGDANEAIKAELAAKRWAGKRAVMFLDPYGMNVEWRTLEMIRATEAIDVWYLVSLAGLFRQASHDPKHLSPKKRAAITRMLGTEEWEDAWYHRDVTIDLLGQVDQTHQRIADVAAMEEFVGKRLRSLFPKVLPPRRLRSDRKVPSFSLFLAISNPEPKAIGLATKIGNHILKAR
ncbi:MAG: three-Cys-motif partner protein TcmP [Mesorhizobium sp.]|uniref:three-Cys-motif partner protein TcmP n=1 Tax=Mesorhizobium sp. M7A.F.Ca.ET.027.02.1.1 TaxID=2496655 RepID=UPI000FD5B344|nr:three-Cys-motif partner protein TcmP [Mesorhizobium sp. M7A.F.Ca.ET.027.02.1.1]RVD14246.1 three-Cys-motif partner protein TcmP [Mesorhizobium sp. M7A.F.Ca.ET.027.02.1.1]RWD08212.1 MAG: three-Cys-motif partner protein TcmP [Mesorhizobium sp.]